MIRSALSTLLLLLVFPLRLLGTMNPYDAVEALIPGDDNPRVLNTEDLSVIHIDTPFPLLSPVGDFNKDGSEDMVISGIFDLVPEGRKKFFLLVGTRVKGTGEFKQLFWENYAHPAFIHLPGTTGPEDPKDQAFSVSFCVDCTKGFDFYWNKKSGSFLKKPWANRVKNAQKPPSSPEIPREEADKALMLVSEEKEVSQFIAELKKRDGVLDVKISFEKEGKPNHRYWVKVSELKGEERIIFKFILVDTMKNRIIKIKRPPK